MMADWNRRFYRYGKPGHDFTETHPRRLTLIAVIIFICVAIALALYWQRPPQQDYVTATARLGDIENAVLATGRLDAVERVNVGARVSGEVKSLKVKLGDRVTKGQPIADIDDLQQRNDLRNAEAALNVIKAELQAKQAQLKQAESRFKRQRRMLNDEASSREDFETAEATLATTRAEQLSLNARLVQAQIEVDKKKSIWAIPAWSRRWTASSSPWLRSRGKRSTPAKARRPSSSWRGWI